MILDKEAVERRTKHVEEELKQKTCETAGARSSLKATVCTFLCLFSSVDKLNYGMQPLKSFSRQDSICSQ